MKLRIHKNSIRLRVSRSELACFHESGRLEETIYFGPASKLVYVLARDSRRPLLDVEAQPGHISVLLPVDVASQWAETDEVGISGKVDLGIIGTLSVLVEKDFACIDRSDDDNLDSFPNPNAGIAC